MTCFYHDWEIMGGENMAELVQNRQFFPVIIVPDFCSAKSFLNFKRIYLFFPVPDAFASTMINDDI